MKKLLNGSGKGKRLNKNKIPCKGTTPTTRKKLGKRKN